MHYITTKDNTNLFYKDWGTGKPVIFLHGWPLSSDSWDGHAMAVAGGRCNGSAWYFASDLCNPNGMAWDIKGNTLFTVVNERDEIGGDLMPDYLTALPAQFANGPFVGQHGLWNRRPLSGYKVIFVPFVNGRPAGTPIDVLTGFISKEGKAYGRPVGIALDKTGGLLVADDVGNTIWRVAASNSNHG